MGPRLSASRSPPDEPAPKYPFRSDKGKGEQLKFQELSGSTSPSETPSELSHPGLSMLPNISVPHRQSANTAEESLRTIIAARHYAAVLSEKCDEFTSSVHMHSSVSKKSSTSASDYLFDRPTSGALREEGMRIKRRAASGIGLNRQFRSLTFNPFRLHSIPELSVLHNKDLVSSSSSTQSFSKLFVTGGDGATLLGEDRSVRTWTISSITSTQPVRSRSQSFPSDPHRSSRVSRCLSRSHSMPSLIQITSAETYTRAGSLADLMLESSPKEFTPDITADEHDETYMLQCSASGLYQCSVTGLVFHMEGEGVVVYRTVPWNRRLLAQYHKKPAGPLFDIKCAQQSVCQLHLPHCEVQSTGGRKFLVAHVTDEGIEFISPHQITGTHVVINITELSGFGNITDEDSPVNPVRALVLLFYRPPADPHPTSLINVLLLPRNVVLRDVLRFRKKLVGDEIYIETSPHCKLQPGQEYSLSTSPEDDSVLVQPTEAEFDCDNYDNYFPSFQVKLKTILIDIKLLLRDINNSHSVWEREVSLSSTGGRRSTLNLPPRERLLDIRSSFVDSVSEPVLEILLDKLLEKKVIADSEMETADVKKNKSDKARFVIDTVRKKGEAASSKMIEFFCEADPFLCEHLGLI